jgi:hypothetical protein
VKIPLKYLSTSKQTGFAAAYNIFLKHPTTFCRTTYHTTIFNNLQHETWLGLGGSRMSLGRTVCSCRKQKTTRTVTGGGFVAFFGHQKLSQISNIALITLTIFLGNVDVVKKMVVKFVDFRMRRGKRAIPKRVYLRRTE